MAIHSSICSDPSLWSPWLFSHTLRIHSIGKSCGLCPHALWEAHYSLPFYHCERIQAAIISPWVISEVFFFLSPPQHDSQRKSCVSQIKLLLCSNSPVAPHFPQSKTQSLMMTYKSLCIVAPHFLSALQYSSFTRSKPLHYSLNILDTFLTQGTLHLLFSFLEYSSPGHLQSWLPPLLLVYIQMSLSQWKLS